MQSRLIREAALTAAIAICIAGCAVGPKYQRPAVQAPAAWKSEGPWRLGEPRDQIPKGAWWEIFADANLNALETQAMAANPALQGAVARLDQARALATLSLAPLYPQVAAAPSAQRSRLSGNRPLATASVPLTQNTFAIPFTVTYEPDLFGRVRRIEAASASLQASAADLENVRLLIASEVAGDYFALRQLDEEIAVLDRTVASFEQGLNLVENRARGGVASGLDVAQEQALLDGTRTQAILLRQQRAQFEDALAALIGQPASSFRLATKPMPTKLPAIPAGVPTDLLERRPDIAEAERQMAVANAQIGIARSAFYPSLSLSGAVGWQSTDIAKLLNASSTFWSLGVAAVESIFTGGARRAQVQFAQAGYQGTVDNYRGTVLTAFEETEDNLASLTVLDQAHGTQRQAVEDSRKALTIATNRYTGGLVSYLDVINAQQTLLANERLAVQLEGQRLVSSVLLIKALGGGWDAASIAAMQVKPTLKQAVAP